MSGRSSTRGRAKLVKQFMTVTGASKDVATSMLEACNGNVELAISMHLDGGDSSAGQAATNGSASAANPVMVSDDDG